MFPITPIHFSKFHQFDQAFVLLLISDREIQNPAFDRNHDAAPECFNPGNLGQLASGAGVLKLQLVRLLGRFDQNHRVWSLPDRPNNFIVPFMPGPEAGHLEVHS